MAMPKTSVAYINGISVTVYEYEHAGDTLPVHDHKSRPHADHFVIVSVGELEVLDERGEVTTLAGPGDIVQWPVGTPHGFRARTEGAKAHHIRALDLRDVTLPAGTEQAGTIRL